MPVDERLSASYKTSDLLVFSLSRYLPNCPEGNVSRVYVFLLPLVASMDPNLRELVCRPYIRSVKGYILLAGFVFLSIKLP